ncbi:MAG: hypothetical protein D8M57_16785 [Candidatus Scalindua sp. AMX11]|nr:MAG: hypothetical protein DWQ00_00915 [Candidatus Scalindua sp.]NOG82977.1 hypothetical protein [Planctomycetota bacterium]RZV68049.1 MAG: hypothetical protein EX341_16765 [Candidatus Scalindua sp. SCAELEC01]TDE63741.1 MAG: hypothetical protein D8M57_16785 [Candidatus Scalindua sp. AMX11]GJQ60476.1 MAG: hypothetical protein SCALA701_32770 [Candidatus Scalindua sp.]
MRCICLFRFLFIVSCITGVLGAISSSLLAQDPFDKEQIKKKYVLGPEDVIKIEIWNHENLTRTIEVPEGGEFTYPHIGAVKAEGLSIFQLEELLKRRLSDGFIKSPQVTVTVENYKSKKVFILGHVREPGIYNVRGRSHILELISKAGGFTSEAGRTVTIVRSKTSSGARVGFPHEEDEENIIFTIDLGQYGHNSKSSSFIINSEDYIYVNEKQVIFVSGHVGTKGKLDWERGMTVRQAITLSGGFTELAAQKRVKIIRTINGKEKKIKAKMHDIVKPNDVIEVPERRF